MQHCSIDWRGISCVPCKRTFRCNPIPFLACAGDFTHELCLLHRQCKVSHTASTDWKRLTSTFAHSAQWLLPGLCKAKSIAKVKQGQPTNEIQQSAFALPRGDCHGFMLQNPRDLEALKAQSIPKLITSSEILQMTLKPWHVICWQDYLEANQLRPEIATSASVSPLCCSSATLRALSLYDSRHQIRLLLVKEKKWVG